MKLFCGHTYCRECFDDASASAVENPPFRCIGHEGSCNHLVGVKELVHNPPLSEMSEDIQGCLCRIRTERILRSFDTAPRPSAHRCTDLAKRVLSLRASRVSPRSAQPATFRSTTASPARNGGSIMPTEGRGPCSSTRSRTTCGTALSAKPPSRRTRGACTYSAGTAWPISAGSAWRALTKRELRNASGT